MKYDDLSPEAQAKAREWWIECEGHDWGSTRAPDLYEDMAKCLSFLGIEVSENDFQWSGFYSQGDGLVFSGSWRADRVDMNGLAEYAPLDQELNALAPQFMAIMLRWPQATTRITTVSRKSDLPRMDLEDTFVDDNETDMPGNDCKVLGALIERAAAWCYSQLRESYEYDTSDEAAEEAIEANEYDFDEDGAITLAGCAA